MYGDLELVIKQFNGEYNANHTRLRAYRNDVMDLLKTLEESKLIFVPGKRNISIHNLAFAARTCLTPIETKDCTAQIKFRPAVLDNEKYWKVFEGDKQIEDFLLGRNEFELSDSDSKSDENCLQKQSPKKEKPSGPVEINMLNEKIETHTEEHKDT